MKSPRPVNAEPFQPHFFGGNQYGKRAKREGLKQFILLRAAELGGRLTLYRIDRETKEMVRDEITSDMPVDEIIL